MSTEELVHGVRIELGLSPLTDCKMLDANDDDTVTVDELVLAVSHALTACP